MPIKTTPVKTFVKEYICDECRMGEMVRHTDTVLMTSPPQYPHKCNECDEVRNFSEVYPQTIVKYFNQKEK
jgi:hypothetical protein